jgi:hypothetical protein
MLADVGHTASRIVGSIHSHVLCLSSDPSIHVVALLDILHNHAVPLPTMTNKRGIVLGSRIGRLATIVMFHVTHAPQIHCDRLDTNDAGCRNVTVAFALCHVASTASVHNI